MGSWAGEAPHTLYRPGLRNNHRAWAYQTPLHLLDSSLGRKAGEWTSGLELQPYLESSYPPQECWTSLIYLFIRLFIYSAEHQAQGHKHATQVFWGCIPKGGLYF